MDGMDKNGLLNGRWTMDNGRWTMDRDYVAPFRADSNIADPTDLLDPSDPSDPSDPTNSTDQLSVSRPCPVRVPSVWGVGVSPRQAFSCGSWLKILMYGWCFPECTGVQPGWASGWDCFQAEGLH